MNAKWWSTFVENYRRVLKCQQLLVTVESSRERKIILTTEKKKKQKEVWWKERGGRKRKQKTMETTKRTDQTIKNETKKASAPLWRSKFLVNINSV